MRRRLLSGVLLGLCIPYTVTLAWTGTIHGEESRPPVLIQSGRKILLDGNGSVSYMDVEEYLPGVIARQIPVEFEPEALRAQAIIARTYIYQQMEGKDEIPASALDLDYLEQAQMKKLWGSDSFADAYKKLETAVASSSGQVITYEGTYIDPLFCRASSGRTRKGDEYHPYLQPAECPGDVEAEGYLQALNWTKEEFAGKINSIPDGPALTGDQVPDQIQVVARDDAGYVLQVQMGISVLSGETVQYALGLASSNFTLEEYAGNIRAVTKGIGHGYGLSQVAANEKAKEGWKAEDILGYFYKNIAVISE